MHQFGMTERMTMFLTWLNACLFDMTECTPMPALDMVCAHVSLTNENPKISSNTYMPIINNQLATHMKQISDRLQ